MKPAATQKWAKKKKEQEVLQLFLATGYCMVRKKEKAPKNNKPK